MIQPKDEEIRDAKISGIRRQVVECLQSAYTKGYETCFEQKQEIYQRGYEDGREVGKIQVNAIEYQKGYEDGQKAKVEVVHSTEVDDAYKKGLSDAWEIMRKIHAMDMAVRKEIFGYFNPSSLIKEYSVQDAINILREEEEKQKKSCDTCFYGDEHDGDTNMFCIYNCTDDTKSAWKPKEEKKQKRSCDTCAYGSESSQICLYSCLDDDRSAWRPKEDYDNE